MTATIPTATGAPATDLTDAYYRGTLSLTSHSINATSGFTEELENSILSSSNMAFYLNITNNNLTWADYHIDEFEVVTDEQVQQSLESRVPVQLLKSGSKYSVSEVGDYSIDDGYINKLYIEFTISGDNILITYIYGVSVDYVVDGVNYKYSYKTTYEGTLTNYTPTFSGS